MRHKKLDVASDGEYRRRGRVRPGGVGGFDRTRGHYIQRGHAVHQVLAKCGECAERIG